MFVLMFWIVDIHGNSFLHCSTFDILTLDNGLAKLYVHNIGIMGESCRNEQLAMKLCNHVQCYCLPIIKSRGENICDVNASNAGPYINIGVGHDFVGNVDLQC